PNVPVTSRFIETRPHDRGQLFRVSKCARVLSMIHNHRFVQQTRAHDQTIVLDKFQLLFTCSWRSLERTVLLDSSRNLATEPQCFALRFRLFIEFSKCMHLALGLKQIEKHNQLRGCNNTVLKLELLL